MAVNLFDTAERYAVKIIASSMRRSATKERHYCMTENYLHSPISAILMNVLSASCRCRLIDKNLRFIHAAATRFVKAV
jgi:hypothetical protein